MRRLNDFVKISNKFSLMKVKTLPSYASLNRRPTSVLLCSISLRFVPVCDLLSYRSTKVLLMCQVGATMRNDPCEAEVISLD